jgi:hypothetical protein
LSSPELQAVAVSVRTATRPVAARKARRLLEERVLLKPPDGAVVSCACRAKAGPPRNPARTRHPHHARAVGDERRWAVQGSCERAHRRQSDPCYVLRITARRTSRSPSRTHPWPHHPAADPPANRT